MPKGISVYIFLLWVGSFVLTLFVGKTVSSSIYSSTSYSWKPPYPWVDFSKKSSRKKGNLSEISISVNEEDFFSFTKGIYVKGIVAETQQQPSSTFNWLNRNANYFQKGKQWKRKAKLMFEKTNLSIPCKINIHGNNTRVYPQKSLAIEFSSDNLKETGQAIGMKVFSSVVLRNAGNDWGVSFCRDPFVQQLISPLNLESQGARMYPVYLNEQFLGIHFLMQKIDEKYLAKKYGVKKKEITIIYNGLLDKGKSKGLKHFREAIEELNSLSENAAFDSIKGFDPNDFVYFLAVNMIVANKDWPNNNVKCFSIGQAPFKFIYYDFDITNGYEAGSVFNIDMHQYILRRWGWLKMAYHNLIKNTSFRKKLNNCITNLLQNEFSLKNQLSQLQSLYNDLQHYMPLQIARWRYPNSISEWEKAFNTLKQFIIKRHRYLSTLGEYCKK